MANIDWPGLLKWSTKYHDGTSDISKFKQLSEEDRKFLEGAMEQAFGQIEDPNKVMEEAVTQLRDDSRTNESVLTALEVIDRCCDDPDCARNCERLGAVQAILDMLKESSEKGFLGAEAEVCRRSAEILALLCANNPVIQQAAAKRGAVELLTTVVTSEAASASGASSEPRLKCLRALSAVVRGEESLETAFIEKHDGVALLVSALKPGETSGLKLREKAAQMASGLLCADSEAVKATLKGHIETLARTLYVSAQGGSGLLEVEEGEETDEGSDLQYREVVANFALRVATAAASVPEVKAAVRGPLSDTVKARCAAITRSYHRKPGADAEQIKEELGLLLQAVKILA